MPSTRAQAKIAVACGAEASLLHLPVETRLQIYGIVLLADFSGGDEGRASDKPDNAVDNDAASEESFYLTCLDPDPPPDTRVPRYDNRQAYGQLLLVCKMIHAEAAPLFYSRVTFFVKEPFKFANTFLRRLPTYKITSIRHLELRLSWWDFRYVNYKARSKVLNDLITVFKTYRELSHLDSLALTMPGCVGLLCIGWSRQPIFHPCEGGHKMCYASEKIMSCMSEAARAVADTIATAGLDILEDVGDIFGENTPIENIMPGIGIVRVTMQRKE